MYFVPFYHEIYMHKKYVYFLSYKVHFLYKLSRENLFKRFHSQNMLTDNEWPKQSKAMY